MNAQQVSGMPGRSPFEVRLKGISMFTCKCRVCRVTLGSTWSTVVGSAAHGPGWRAATQLCASFPQAVAQDLSSAVESSYPTDELSHPEYVNDDFRMFTFKVGDFGNTPAFVMSFCVIALHLTRFFVYALCICCLGTELVSPAFGVA